MSIKRFVCKFLQYLPIASSSLATIICAVLFVLDYMFPDISAESIRIAYELVVVTSGFITVYCFSRVFGYCLRQKIGIYYTYVFFICLWLRRYTEGEDGIFGDYIEEAHLALLIIGVVYLSYVFYNRSVCCRK